jgi:AraC family transcriptional regulator
MDIVSRATLNAIDFTEVVYEERLRLPRHVHPTAGFCFVLDGEYEERYGSRTLDCRARSVTFSPAGSEHGNTFANRRAHCFTIDLPPALVERVALDAPCEYRGGPLAWLAARAFEEFRSRDDSSPLVMEGLVLEMLGQLSRAQSSATPRVSPAVAEARRIVEDRYADELPLRELAAAIGRHPVHLASEFRRSYGETIGDLVRRLRIEHACRALQKHECAIADVAADCGFANQSSFTRAFRRVTGTTPAEYRRRALRAGAKR